MACNAKKRVAENCRKRKTDAIAPTSALQVKMDGATKKPSDERNGKTMVDSIVFNL